MSVTEFDRTTAYEVHHADGVERFEPHQHSTARAEYRRRAREPYGAALWRGYAGGDRWEKISEDMGPSK